MKTTQCLFVIDTQIIMSHYQAAVLACHEPVVERVFAACAIQILDLMLATNDDEGMGLDSIYPLVVVRTSQGLFPHSRGFWQKRDVFGLFGQHAGDAAPGGDEVFEYRAIADFCRFERFEVAEKGLAISAMFDETALVEYLAGFDHLHELPRITSIHVTHVKRTEFTVPPDSVQSLFIVVVMPRRFAVLRVRTEGRVL